MYNLPKGKTIICVFAHPDDESFGPAGTIYRLAQQNSVYIICVTNGDAGNNRSKDTKRPLGEIRADELRKSSHILGVKQVFFLNFPDGSLSNNIYHTLADKIETIVKRLKPSIFLTWEFRGVSGHIDHITVSFVTTFVFKKLSYVKYVYYYCLDKEHRAPVKKYFIYFPPGYTDSEINWKHDVSNIWHHKVEAMKIHRSQTKDVRRILNRYRNNKLSKVENFIILHK